MKKFSVIAFLAVICATVPVTYAAPAFSASAAGTSSVSLTWTTDTYVVSHEIFYSATVLNESNLASAQSYGSMPMAIPNVTQNVSVSGLNADTTYYFAYRYMNVEGITSVLFASAHTNSAGGGGGGGGTGGGGGIPSPRPVTNFVAARNGTDVTLAWDTPVSSVVARAVAVYSTSPISESNFNTLQEALNISTVSGMHHAEIVQNLSRTTTYYFAVRTVSVTGEVSPIVTTLLNAETSGGGGGGIPAPTPVTNFVATPGTTYLDLSWDTPVSTVIAQFDMRCSNTALTINNFDSMPFGVNIPLAISGTRQGMRVEGLSASTQYYCGIRTRSVTGELSSLVFLSATTNGGGGGGGGGGSSSGGSSSGGGGGTPTTISSPSITINNGAETTESVLVTLSLTAVNTTEMMISNYSDFRDAKWEPFASTTQWVLLAGNGGKTVYAKFRNNIQNVTAGPVSDSIILISRPVIVPQEPEIIVISTEGESRPYTSIISISPNATFIPNENKVVVVLTAHPGSSAKYGAHLEMDYPTDILEFEKIEYGDGWVPEFGQAYNYNNESDGRLIKTAAHAAFGEPINFAMVIFTVKKAGDGIFDTNSFSSLRELPEYATNMYQTQADVTTLASNIGKTRLAFASLVSLSTQDNTIAVVSAFIFLFLCYAAYVISMHKTGKRKLVLPLPVRREK